MYIYIEQENNKLWNFQVETVLLYVSDIKMLIVYNNKYIYMKYPNCFVVFNHKHVNYNDVPSEDFLKLIFR